MRPLYDRLLEQTKNEKARFHMPGHSGTSFPMFNNEIDFTEIPQLDNLLQSDGCILQAEQLLANAYRSKYALMCTQGSTTLMQISIRYVINNGYSIVSYGEMHSSFYNTLRLNNAEYITVDSEVELEDNLNKICNMVAVFVTSPNYFGEIKDLIRIKKIIEKKRGLLIVDAAHGAHYAFSNLLPNLQNENADIMFCSLHKTMPCQTGSSILLVNSTNIYDELKFYRSMMHSTSPNYVSMASMDYARELFEQKGQKYYDEIKTALEKYNGTFAGYSIIKNDDFSRLVLQKEGIDAYKVLQELHKCCVDIEMAYLDKLVLIVTPYNLAKLSFVEEVLKSIPTEPLQITNVVHTAKKDIERKSGRVEFVDLESSIGCTVACEVGIYPPSIPVVYYNEIIDSNSLNILIANKEHLFGLVNNKVPVLK